MNGPEAGSTMFVVNAILEFPKTLYARCGIAEVIEVGELFSA